MGNFIPAVSRSVKSFSFWLNAGAKVASQHVRRVDKDRAKRHRDLEERGKEVCQSLGLHEFGRTFAVETNNQRADFRNESGVNEIFIGGLQRCG